jgi:hypothetical protein
MRNIAATHHAKVNVAGVGGLALLFEVLLVVGDEPLDEILSLDAQLLELLAILVQEQPGIAHRPRLQKITGFRQSQGTTIIAFGPVWAQENASVGISKTLVPLFEAGIAGGAVRKQSSLCRICLDCLAVALCCLGKLALTEEFVAFGLQLGCSFLHRPQNKR